MSDPIRVRIAPSPTGYFHVGNARTALFNWLFAHKHDGTFVLRVEDTDRSRYVEGAVENALRDLAWLELEPDEGPEHGGDHGPYYQSERLERYREHAERLLASGSAYRCFCTPEELDEMRERRAAAGLKVGYDRRCRNLSPEEIAEHEAAGHTPVVRLKVPLGDTVRLNDLLRGPIAFDTSELEDVVLLKSDGYPTYHLAVVVDDHAMAISHVLRADEWIPSAPYQVLLYEAFGWQAPVWAHLPMVLNPDGKGKLSKRRTVGDDGQPLEQMVQVRQFRAAGYLPEAMFNYLALLGWAYSGDEDVFTREQALARFELEDVKTSPAAWNQEKLDWMNGVYIRALPAEALAERLLPFLHEAGLPAEHDELTAIAPLVQERIQTLAEAVPLVDFFWADQVHPAREDLVPRKLEAAQAAAALDAVTAELEALERWDRGPIEDVLRGTADTLGLKAGPTFQPVRVAATGKRVAPPLFETLELLGRERTLARLKAARPLLDEE